jgi:UPF0755 protein
MTNDAVIDILLTGPIIETFRITVREGLWIGEILDEIAGQTDFDSAQLRRALRATESPFLQGPASDPISWEGLLFPDTYDFPLDASPTDILQRLADTMKQPWTLTGRSSPAWSPIAWRCRWCSVSMPR